MSKRKRWPELIALVVFIVFSLVAILGPALEPYAPNAGSAIALAAPSVHHLMGTDETGRDVLSRMIAGDRVSFVVGLLSVALGGLVGTALGMVAGTSAGRLGEIVIMRTMDAILAFPVIVLAAVLSGVAVGHGSIGVGPVRLSQELTLALVLALILVPIFARIARGSVLGEMKADYVVAAQACGVRRLSILVRFVLPNIATPLIVQASFSVGLAIVAEAGISFLGLGIQPPQASWGNIIGGGQSTILLGAWWLVVLPGLAIAAVTVSCAVLGEWCRKLLDPRRATRVEKVELSADVVAQLPVVTGSAL